MADCWNVSWNVDPLALSVPDRLPLPEDPPVVVEEEQAARTRAIATTGSPTAAHLMR
jgi:hypothetical protein